MFCLSTSSRGRYPHTVLGVKPCTSSPHAVLGPSDFWDSGICPPPVRECRCPQHLQRTPTVDDAALGEGARLPHRLQMRNECIYSLACHPAAGGRGITLATMKRRASLGSRRWLTHWHTSGVHHATAEVLVLHRPCRVFLKPRTSAAGKLRYRTTGVIVAAASRSLL